MASAMRKMAVYLGLVEDDHRYQDKYDSYGEYEDYDDQADRPEQADEPEARGGRDDLVGYQAADWRPEIHDSDGLLIFNGKGERLWRPLSNPNGPTINSFADRSPKGFGLLQRDRNHDHYQDDGVFYERRPSLWIEPVGDWGAGGSAQVLSVDHERGCLAGGSDSRQEGVALGV